MTAITFNVTTIAADPIAAVRKVDHYLPMVEGSFETTGTVSAKSVRHGLWNVEVTGTGNTTDLWIVLTSYGMSPAKGVSKFGDRIDRYADAVYGG